MLGSAGDGVGRVAPVADDGVCPVDGCDAGMVVLPGATGEAKPVAPNRSAAGKPPLKERDFPL